MAISLQQVLCLLAALYSTIWTSVVWQHPEMRPYYLELAEGYSITSTGEVGNKWDQDPSEVGYMVLNTLKSYGKWVLALMNFVAISLLVPRMRKIYSRHLY